MSVLINEGLDFVRRNLPENASLSLDTEAGKQRLQGFLRTVSEFPQSALLLDFDGTLAPFRVDRFQARPYAGIAALLEKIRATGRTRLTLVTGRPAKEAAGQLALDPAIEVWGLHGAERLYPDGGIEREVLPQEERDALDGARAAVRNATWITDLGLLIEEKRNAVVLHWRGAKQDTANQASLRAVEMLRNFRQGDRMMLLEFDGGVELRAGRNKGDAARGILAEMAQGTPAAYLGDDVTDEDAFHVLAQPELQKRGLGVLVRKQPRATAAGLIAKPPVELRLFLRAWLHAVHS